MKNHNTTENYHLQSTLAQALKFEKVVGKILEQRYQLSDIGQSSQWLDYKLANGVYIDVKFSRYNDANSFIKRIHMQLHQKNALNIEKYIFVTNYFGQKEFTPNEEKRSKLTKLNIITLENLLYLCEDNEPLKIELLSCIPFSTENLTATEIKSDILDLLESARKHEIQTKVDNSNSFSKNLSTIKAGKTDFRKYEVFCKNYVETIFISNIDHITEQKTSNKNLYRYDLVASIKDDPNKFWKFIYDKFNSCFILFECKNYRKKISQEQVYLTERYLYNTALRNVAIILTRKGADKHATLAAQDILKEHGKLILILDDNDIKKMEQLYNGNEKDYSPSDYLLDKAKEFLLNLDK